MKKGSSSSWMFVSILCFCFNITGQIEFPSKHSVGFEALGNAGIYSLVYNRTAFEKKKFIVQLRPQFAVIPGASESKLPTSIVPILGANAQIVFGNWLLNINPSAGIDFSLGPGSYGQKLISSISFGPKFYTDFAVWGLHYGYFFREPEYFYFDTYPHFFGLSMEAEI